MCAYEVQSFQPVNGYLRVSNVSGQANDEEQPDIQPCFDSILYALARLFDAGLIGEDMNTGVAGFNTYPDLIATRGFQHVPIAALSPSVGTIWYAALKTLQPVPVQVHLVVLEP